MPTPPERKLIDAARDGTVADYCKPDVGDYTIRAEVLRDLATGENPKWQVSQRGIRARCATIVGEFDFTARRIDHPLELKQSYIEQQLVLKGVSAFSIDLGGSYAAKAIEADELHTDNDLNLDAGFVANGAVLIEGATIDGYLDFRGGKFLNRGGIALGAYGIHVKRAAFLGSVAEGEVRLTVAEIGGDLECRGGRFENPDGDALLADSIRVAGSVFFNSDKEGRNFSSKGNVRLPGAETGSQLSFQGADLSGTAVDLHDAKIAGSLRFIHIAKSPNSIDLRGAQVGELVDDPLSWEKVGSLKLEGFEYREIGTDESAPQWSPQEREAWLERQSSPQPYEQLANVLRQSGQLSEARQILIAEWKERRKGLGLWPRIGNYILEYTVGYGYLWWRGIYWLLGLLLLGAWMAWLAYNRGLIQKWEFEIGPSASRTEATAYPAPGSIAKLRAEPIFWPLLWSLDSFNLPFLELRQKEHFRLIEPQPPLHKTCWFFWTTEPWRALRHWLHPAAAQRRRRCSCYKACEYYFAVQAMAGWILLALIAAALTGVFEKL